MSPHVTLWLLMWYMTQRMTTTSVILGYYLTPQDCTAISQRITVKNRPGVSAYLDCKQVQLVPDKEIRTP